MSTMSEVLVPILPVHPQYHKYWTMSYRYHKFVSSTGSYHAVISPISQVLDPVLPLPPLISQVMVPIRPFRPLYHKYLSLFNRNLHYIPSIGSCPTVNPYYITSTDLFPTVTQTFLPEPVPFLYGNLRYTTSYCPYCTFPATV